MHPYLEVQYDSLLRSNIFTTSNTHWHTLHKDFDMMRFYVHMGAKTLHKIVQLSQREVLGNYML